MEIEGGSGYEKREAPFSRRRKNQNGPANKAQHTLIVERDISRRFSHVCVKGGQDT